MSIHSIHHLGRGQILNPRQLLPPRLLLLPPLLERQRRLLTLRRLLPCLLLLRLSTLLYMRCGGGSLSSSSLSPALDGTPTVSSLTTSYHFIPLSPPTTGADRWTSTLSPATSGQISISNFYGTLDNRTAIPSGGSRERDTEYPP